MSRAFLKLVLLAMFATAVPAGAEEPPPEQMRGGPPVEFLSADFQPVVELEKRVVEPATEAKADILEAHHVRTAAFGRALGEYQRHRDVNDWRMRVGIDRRLLQAAGKLPAEYLAARLDAAPRNLEVATAVAVCLGGGSKEDPPEFVAGLLDELLASPVERVRYRAAEAIVQRVQDGTLPAGINQQLAEAVTEALAVETNQLNAGSMRYAVDLLNQEMADGSK